MKKLSFFLMAMLFTCATTLQAAEVTETIAMKGFGGLTTTSYENVTKTGTSDLGTEMVAYAFNPTNGQIRGNKTTIAGASVTTADKNKNWSLYNTQAMPGAIKKITVTQTATGSNMFKGKLFVALGTTNQGAVTTVTGAQQNTTGTATEFTFDIDTTQGYTYFKLLSNVAFTGGSVAGAVVTVTYVTAEGGEEEVTKYTVTANVNDPAMGSVSGAGEYAEGKTATLTANANPGYKFVNWSNASTDNPLKITVTEDIEITANFEAVPPMTCAEAAAAASGATVVLNPFDVVAVVKGAGYIYIKDESGVALIYDFTMDDQLKAGDHVEGFVGVSSPYNGLPELKPSVAFADLTVTPGTAPEPTLFTEVPTKADLNKYVKFENVTLTANATFTTESATNATMVVNGTNVTLRNTFKLAATLSKDKAYNIVGFAAIYNSTIQVYFLSVEEYVAPVVNHTITVSANPAEAGTVTGGGEYEEGATATLTATANEGYEFVKWTENEVEVSTDAEYTFEVLADRALVANFELIPPTKFTVTATAENGTVEGAGEYEEGAEATLTATAAEGYEFVNWTSGETVVSTENPYKFTVTADLALVANFKKAAPATETIYFVNALNWTGTISAYAWTTDPNAAWPGAAATKEAEQIGGYDVYSYTAEAGKYANVIFNGTGGQTADLVWTAGKYYVLDGWYTKEEAEAKLATPIVDEVVYFVNNKKWSKVNAYAWDPANAAWPGAAATKEAEQIGGFDVYSYSAAPGTYQKVIFNDGGSNQTSDMVWTAGKYIVNNQWYTKEEAEAALAAPVVTTWTMVGDKALFGTDWDLNATANDLVKQEDGSWVLTLTNKTLAAKSYEYKAAKDRSWNTTVPGGNNAKLTISKAGQYDVTFTLNAAATSVTAKATYIPAKYNVTVTAENGTVTGAGEYEEGAEATLTATAAEGYEFVNWTSGETVVSTENPYTFTVTADIALVANFKEAEPEIEWMEMELEMANLVTEVMEIEDAKYLSLTASDIMSGAEVMLFLNNYADVDDDYEVNAGSSLITFAGFEFTVLEGTISQTSETEKGTLYTGTVYAYTGSGDETMYAAFTLTMYATPAIEVAIAEATARIDEETGSLVLNAEWTKDGVAYPVFVTVAGYEEGKEVYEGAQISELQIGDDDNWLDFAVANTVTVAQDGQNISVEGEYTSWNTGTAYTLTISGKLPVEEPEVIEYVLNGGVLPAPAVPTNEELWIAFMPYYQEYYDVVRAEQPIASVAVFLSAGMGDDATIFTSEDSDYKWLGDYIIKVTTEQGAALTTLAYWKFNVQAFFNANQYTAWPKSADFTEAGKPENWGAAYEAAHEVVLPTEPVEEDYVLPTPTKSGSTFKGWYNNAEGTGEAYTVIPAGWAGTLYAIWEQGTTTALENIAVEGKAVKAIINGQLIIIKNGVQYNAQGQVIK